MSGIEKQRNSLFPGETLFAVRPFGMPIYLYDSSTLIYDVGMISTELKHNEPIIVISFGDDFRSRFVITTDHVGFVYSGCLQRRIEDFPARDIPESK